MFELILHATSFGHLPRASPGGGSSVGEASLAAPAPWPTTPNRIFPILGGAEMARVEISREFIQEVMQSEPVRERLASEASSRQSRVDALAAGEGVEMDTWLTHGTRPKGRPFSRVWGDNAEQEFGSSRSERYRIMGRAAEGG